MPKFFLDVQRPRISTLTLLAFVLFTFQAFAQPAYTVTEIATGDSGGYTSTLNGKGQVAGRTYQPGHAFFWNGSSLQDLGTLGGAFSVAYAINEAGLVAGQADDSAGGRPAFLWDGTLMRNLGTLGGHSSVGTAINSRGQVVGFAEISGSPNKSFFWSDGVMSELVDFGFGSYAVAINDAGTIAGAAGRSDDSSTRAVIWNGTSGMRDLGSLGGRDSSARAINGNGWVTGQSQTSSGVPSAFLWKGAQMINIGAGIWSEGLRINAKGVVLGRFVNNSNFQRAYIWDGKKAVDLGTPQGVNVAGDSFGFSINSNGDVVGWADDAVAGPFTGFLWSNGRMTRLQDLLPAGSRWRRIEKGIDINDRGQILAFAHDDIAGESRLLLLNPPGNAPRRR